MTGARIVLTPGPVTTSAATRQAMLRDYSLNEPEFLALTAEVRATLLALAGGEKSHVCVLLQGTGNAANEAALGTLVPRAGRVLIVDNGFYGARLKEIADAIGLCRVALDLPITQPVSAERLAAALDRAHDVSHVALCHVDTGTGLLNPIEPLAEVCRARGVGLILDAVASFGGLPLDLAALDAEAVVLSPNKWLEGVPGFGVVLVRRSALEGAAGRCHSYCLDLYRQWQSFEASGRWRFTPPTPAVAAAAAALRQYQAEGRAARLARISRNWRCLVDGMRALGFATVLADEVAAPVIATFHQPADPHWDRERFFTGMLGRGFVTFRGSLTPSPSFRIGCMGAIDHRVMAAVVRAVGETVAEFGVTDCRPAPHARSSQRVEVDFGRTAEDYARHRAGFPERLFERLLATGAVRPGERLLDLGTGTGTFARGFAGRGLRVTGLDVSAAMLEQARRLDRAAGLTVDYVMAPAEASGLPDASFEVVSAGQCWHWFDRPRAAAEIRRLLRPGGRVVIATFDWLPLPRSVVAATEDLIRRHNPAWTMGGGSGIHPGYLADLSGAGFVGLETFSFDQAVAYGHAAWRGRIRASAGIAASLAPDAVARFDAEHATLLRRDFSTDPLSIPHRCWAAIGYAP